MTTRARKRDGRLGEIGVAPGDVVHAASASADLIDILDTLDLPIVVVGRDVTLTRFNRAAEAALGLKPSDVGCSPRAIGVLADVLDIEQLCAQVIADGAACRRDVRDRDRWFLLRIAPYTSHAGPVVGAVLTFTNVTAFRASIEQAIYEREYTKAILNTVIEPLVILDAELRVQTANRAFYTLFQVSREQAEGVPLYNLGSHAWDTPWLWPLLKAILSDNSEFQTCELEHAFPTLRHRTMLLDARRLARTGNHVDLLLLTFQDITERKRAEEELRQAKENLSDFVENATIAMHWVGPDGMILWANRTELELLGYAREEYIGHHIAEFHADSPVIEDVLQRLRRAETLHEYPVRLRRKDGSIRHVLINSNVLWEDGEFVHTRCFTRDITERKQAEEALRESERRFHEMIDALPAAIYTTDAEGRLTHFNPAAVELSGRTPELGTDYWCVTWKLYYPDGTPMPHDECPMAIALKEGRAVRGSEAIAERPDGQRIWFEPYPTPLRDSEGRVVGGINMLVDITERKQAEQALIENARQQEALYQLADQLHRTKSLEEVYNAALQAIVGALQCDRASILLFDDTGVMRFIGWRGLSDAYRQATEGHSPWQSDEKNPEPICVNDIDTAEISDSLKAVIKREGIGALAFIPLVSNGRLIGKFMTYFNATHVFSRNELELSLTIARQLAFGLDRKRAENALRESEERFRQVAEVSPQFIWVSRADGSLEYINQRWVDYSGLDFVGTANKQQLAAAVHPDQRAEMFSRWERSVATSETFEMEARLRGRDGTFRWFLIRTVPLRDDAGRVVKWFGASTDITERKQAEVSERLLAEMRERNRLAQELHDTVAQALGYLNLKIGMTSTLLAGNQVDPARASLQELKGVISETYTDVREEIFYLRAKALSDLSFMELLERYIDKYRRFYNLDIQLLQEAELAAFQFPPEETSQLIRTIQEALINIRKHARVNTATLRLGQENGAICISIEDGGQGFDPAQSQEKTSSFGLQIMRERLESVGGSLEIDTAPGRGTRIVLHYKG
jgi:PAS domain S-box-containing protein